MLTPLCECEIVRQDGVRGFPRVEDWAQPANGSPQARIAYLEKKIRSKDEVLSELMAEHVAL